MKLRHLLILFILILPTLTPMLHSGYWGASDEMHLAWLHQMDAAVDAGKFPPRYVPDLSYGFGYPLFNFVFPLPFYLGELFHLLGASLVDSLKLVFAFSLVASALAMYALIRRFSSPSVAISAALIYSYTPYRATNIFVRGAVGESFGFIFLPLIILSLYQVCTSSSRKWLGIGGLALAGLILSHNITAYMFVPFALLFTLFFITRKRLVSVLSLFSLGLLTSLFFWLPALRDSFLMQYDPIFNFQNHFPNLSRLLRPYWGYGGSSSVPGEGMSFFIGSANLLLLAITVIIFIFAIRRLSRPVTKFIISFFLFFLAAVFMMNYRSAPIWETLPFIAYFQFPWRFLIITTLATSVMALSLNILTSRRWLLILLLPAVILLSYHSFSPQDHFDYPDSYYLSRYIPVPVPSLDYANLQEEYLRLPKNTLLRPAGLYPRVFPDSVDLKVTSLNPYDTLIVSNTVVSQTFNLNKYLFPGFSATIDGQPLALFAGKPFGQIAFTLPPGPHTIRITYQETPANLVLDSLSLIGLLFCLYLALKRSAS